MSVDDLSHEIRNSTAGIRHALRHCKLDCPQSLGNLQVRQEIKHHVNRIERALNLYVSNQRFNSFKRTPDTG